MTAPKYDGVVPLKKNYSLWKYLWFMIIVIGLGVGVFIIFDVYDEDGFINGEKVDESTIIDPEEVARIERERIEKMEKDEAEKVAAE